MADTTFGIALFDGEDPQSGGVHYACQSGGAPFSFSSISELSSQMLWVTNARLDTLVDYGLNRNPKIANEGYFRTRISQLIQELNLSHLEPPRLASFLANLLGNAAVMLQRQLGMVQFPVGSVTQGVGQLFGTPEAHESTDLYRVAERAAQRFTTAERSRRMQGAEVFSFWAPRYDYAQMMLMTDLPKESVRVVPGHAIPGGAADAQEVVAWAEATKLPIFAQIRIHSLDETVGRLLNYGAGAAEIEGARTAASGGAYTAANMREWCALPELSVLALSGEVEVLRVVTSDGWINHGLRTLAIPSAQISYSYGLVAENLWCGLMRQPSGYGRISKTLATAWLQAADRMRMLQTAEKLTHLGFEVLNYGNGRVTVACPASLRHLIPRVAMENGLLYPASLEGLEMYPVTKGNRLHLMQSLMSAQEYAAMLRVDGMLLKEL